MGVVRRKLSERDWEGVEPSAYDAPEVAGIEKRELIGHDDGAPHWRLRHFRVPPGGRTARERHPHDHGVYVLSGRARVTLEDRVEEVGPGDVVYVAGDELHQFEALGEGELEFICVAPPR